MKVSWKVPLKPLSGRRGLTLHCCSVFKYLHTWRQCFTAYVYNLFGSTTSNSPVDLAHLVVIRVNWNILGVDLAGYICDIQTSGNLETGLYRSRRTTWVIGKKRKTSGWFQWFVKRPGLCCGTCETSESQQKKTPRLSRGRRLIKWAMNKIKYDFFLSQLCFFWETKEAKHTD